MNRGMKKWAPYKSLNEQIDFINKMRYEKNKKERPLLSPDQEEEINRILVNYNNELCEITYWEDGYTYQVKAPIYRIDVEQKRIYFDRYSFIDFIDLVDIKVLD